MKRMLRWIAAVIVAGLVVFVLYLGLAPVPPDVAAGAAQPQTSDQEKCAPTTAAAATSAQTLTVHAGERIQDAVDRAQPGDTVLVEPGVYRETVRVKISHLTLRGLGQGDQRPVLEGDNQLGNGVLACGDSLTIESFVIRHYQANGVLVSDVDGVTFRDILTDHTGEYGLFPVRSKNITIERCVATGASDTGLYVGQSENITIRDSEAYGNVSGIEIENSSNALVTNNYAHDNTAGILVFVLPDLERKESTNNRIVQNRVIGNNVKNFGAAGSIVAQVPSGTGILVMAADRNEFTANEIRDNRSVGVAMVGLRIIYDKRADFDVGTEPEGNWIHDNVISNNGTDPSPEAKKFGLPGADLVWDGTGWDNSWQEAATSRFPPWLPDRSWSDFARRFYWRVLGVARRFL